MKITLIGMSNVGKSHWAKELEKKGFTRITCDEIIDRKIGVQNVSQWLGQPPEPEYKKRSEQYLAYEKEAMKEALSIIENAPDDEEIVVDTGGSVVYMEGGILQDLKRLTKIVYLEAPKEVVQKLEELYLKNPKPVIWGDIRSYPELLEERAKKYAALADITLDCHELRAPGFTVDTFLEKIQ